MAASSNATNSCLNCIEHGIEPRELLETDSLTVAEHSLETILSSGADRMYDKYLGAKIRPYLSAYMVEQQAIVAQAFRMPYDKGETKQTHMWEQDDEPVS